MPTMIIDYKNKKEEKILHTFLNSLNIGYYSEEQEDVALIKAYKRITKKNEIPVAFNPSKLRSKQK